jgi:predicted DNA-binding transcriptional regulator YafY
LHDEFRTFRFSRILGLADTEEGVSYPDTRQDDDWNEFVTLTLAPHNKHPARDALAVDLGLKDRPVSNASVNKAIAGFVLTDLRVDCSKAAVLNPQEYPLQLQNRSELLDIESMKLAPGFLS